MDQIQHEMSLPVEIVHMVFENLSPSEVRSVRLTCKKFAAVGAKHGFEEIHFYLRRVDLDKLIAIASHPLISKGVKKLVYEPGTLPCRRLSFEEYSERNNIHIYRLRVERCKKNWLPSHTQDWETPISPDDILENYHQYNKAVDEQEDIVRKFEDYHVLESVMPRLTGLKEVTANNKFAVAGRKTPFDAFFVPIRYSSGGRQMESLMSGGGRRDLQIQSIRGLGIQWTYEGSFLFHKVTEACENMNLKSIQFEFDTVDFSLSADEDRHIDKTVQNVEAGEIANLLQSQPDLESLDIAFTHSSPYVMGYPARLPNIITPGFRWSNLRDVRLRWILTEREELFAFLQQHRSTLQVLHLHYCRFENNTSWIKFFSQMKKTMKLQDVRITGYLTGQYEDPSEYDYVVEGSGEDMDDSEQNWWLGHPEPERPLPMFTRKLMDWLIRDHAPDPFINFKIMTSPWDEDYDEYEYDYEPMDGDFQDPSIYEESDLEDSMDSS
ncbi:hypothetical protein F4819DRAFT_92705 [Hypoxylon fuscum]|nr:hypothetical protein F4819DRAFT_92705 [Hypoxylon fuscum]